MVDLYRSIQSAPLSTLWWGMSRAEASLLLALTLLMTCGALCKALLSFLSKCIASWLSLRLFKWPATPPCLLCKHCTALSSTAQLETGNIASPEHGQSIMLGSTRVMPVQSECVPHHCTIFQCLETQKDDILYRGTRCDFQCQRFCIELLRCSSSVYPLPTELAACRVYWMQG